MTPVRHTVSRLTNHVAPWTAALLMTFAFRTLGAERAGARETRIYDSLFTYSVDVCGATEYQPIGAQNGGHYGHGFMFIKGACFDSSSKDFPRIKVCPPEAGLDAGTGISLDYYYKSVAWTAVDGRDFFFYGDLPPNRPLDEKARDAIIEKAASGGYFSGVDLQEWERQNARPGESQAHFVAREGFGTDYAVALARSVDCTRIPLDAGGDRPKDAIIRDLVNYLNSVNEEVHGSETGLKYDGGSRNCTTLVYNSLASIGFWDPVDTTWTSQGAVETLHHFFDIAAPINTVKNALLRGSRHSLPRFVPSIASVKEYVQPLLRYGWLPAQVGVIVTRLPIHRHENRLFETTARPEFFSLFNHVSGLLGIGPLKARETAYEAIVAEPVMNDLGENLADWSRFYDRSLRSSMLAQYRDEASISLRHYLREKAAFSRASLHGMARDRKAPR